MTTWLTDPRWLWLAAAIPLLGMLVWHARRRRATALATLGDPAALSAQVLDRGSRGWQSAGWLGLIALMALAAAGPRWGDGPPPPVKPGCDAILVVDVSRSMLAVDALPNRLGRAQAALIDLVDAVKARGGHRLGVVAFAGRSRLMCPLTHDYDHVRQAIANLSADPLPPGFESDAFGTRIGAGLSAAVAALDESTRGAQMIVLASDGDDPAGDGEWRDGITAARRAGIPVFVLGVGDAEQASPIPTGSGQLTFRGEPARTRLQLEPLREIAGRTGGRVIAAGTAKPDLTDFVRDTLNRFPTREAVAGTLPQPVPRQTWFLAAALLLSLALCCGSANWRTDERQSTDEYRLTQIRTLNLCQSVLICGFLLLIGAAPASDAALRRGLSELDAGRHDAALAQFERAAERTTDPGLVAFNEGVALFHLNRYAEAADRFRWALSDAVGPRRDRALYNLGCALLQASQGRQGEQLRAAIAAFEQSLAADNLDGDVRLMATENLDLARRLLAEVRSDAKAATASSAGVPADRPSARGSQRGGEGDDRPAGVPQVAERGEADAGARPTTQAPLPGAGRPSVLPDEAVQTPLSPDEARSRLMDAVNRIAAARQAHRLTTAAPPSQKFPDW